MSITKSFLSRTNRISVVPHPPSPLILPDNGGHIDIKDFYMFNDAGTEVEVSELLYDLVRILKPQTILETGTHVGISSSFMAQALEDNKKGELLTFEIESIHRNNALLLWEDLRLKNRITSYLQSSLTYVPPKDMKIGLLFLDSEPQLRYDEFVKFWDYVIPGGYIIIHDLNRCLGHTDKVIHDMYDWPWGDFRETLGPYMKNFQVQTMSLPTPRGFTFFQKVSPDFTWINHIKGLV